MVVFLNIITVDFIIVCHSAKNRPICENEIKISENAYIFVRFTNMFSIENIIYGKNIISLLEKLW